MAEIEKNDFKLNISRYISTAVRAKSSKIRALDPVGWPKIQADTQEAIAELDEHGCCNSFGGWPEEVHAIATPLRIGTGMPLMVISAPGPSQFMRDIRPRLISTVEAIERYFRSRQ